MSAYNMHIKSALGIMIKDPSYIANINRPELHEQTTLCILVDHYADQGTILSNDANRLKELIVSPDKENMEIAKVLLQQKYKIL